MAKNLDIERQDRRQVENVEGRPSATPNVDVYENEQEILLIVDLPGVAESDLRIDLDKDRLTLEARRSDQEPGAAELAAEYRPVDFRRSFLAPAGIDRDKIDAQLTAGVLRLKLPRADALRPRTISVRAG
jgi:HSP20 family protein